MQAEKRRVWGLGSIGLRVWGKGFLQSDFKANYLRSSYMDPDSAPSRMYKAEPRVCSWRRVDPHELCHADLHVQAQNSKTQRLWLSFCKGLGFTDYSTDCDDVQNSC